MEYEVISHIGGSVHSIISEGTRFRGEIDVTGLLRIDGDFVGSIRTDGQVLISKNGRADCTINGNIIVIGGAVRGDIFARTSVEILGSAVVIGNIVTPRLIVHEDVIFHGSCRVKSPALEQAVSLDINTASHALDAHPYIVENDTEENETAARVNVR